MIEELNSECFLQENHESDFAGALGITYQAFAIVPESKDFELHHALKNYAVGWCDAQRLQYKPMLNYMAVMCEKDGYRFWFHITRDTFDKVFNTITNKE